MNGSTGLCLLLGALTGLTALDKWRSLGWRPRGAVQRAGCWALTIAPFFFLATAPPTYALIDRATGLPNAALVVSTSLLAILLWVHQPLVEHGLHQHVGPPGRARRALLSPWPMLGTIALPTTLFALAPIHQGGTPGYPAFIARYATAPLTPAFVAAMAAYPAVAFAQMAYLSLRVAGRLPTADLRLRAWLWAGGHALGLALIAHEFAYIAARRSGLPYDRASLTRGALLLTSVGLLMSGGLVDFGVWVGRYRAYRRLRPLLEALRRATPDVPTHPPRAAGPGLAGLELRLQARAAEIRDRESVLLPYVEPAVT
ncbi:MAG: hypothetical protein M3Q65_19395, partial [Chloroflexota bacterium]|nr:hypothetical protein [Chloroflexota bacterium]